MSAIKALEWREVAGGYAGFIGDRAWTRVDHGWNLAEPYEYRGKRYADLNRAKAQAETDHQMLIISALVDGYGEEAEAARVKSAGDVDTMAAALWRAEATDAGTPQSVADGRTPESFAEQSDELKKRWRKFARVALDLRKAEPTE